MAYHDRDVRIHAFAMQRFNQAPSPRFCLNWKICAGIAIAGSLGALIGGVIWTILKCDEKCAQGFPADLDWFVPKR